MNMFKPTTAKTPEAYISMIDEPRRSQIQTLHDLIIKLTGEKPYIQVGMIGYGSYHYKSTSSEGEWPIIALASQKNYISVYVCASKDKEYLTSQYIDKLPKANIGKSCVRFKKIGDVDLAVLSELIKKGYQMMKG